MADALGMIEARSFPAMVEAADAMVKAAKVELVSFEETGGGYVTAVVRGDVAAVKAGVQGGVPNRREGGEPEGGEGRRADREPRDRPAAREHRPGTAARAQGAGRERGGAGGGLVAGVQRRSFLLLGAKIPGSGEPRRTEEGRKETERAPRTRSRDDGGQSQGAHDGGVEVPGGTPSGRGEQRPRAVRGCRARRRR